MDTNFEHESVLLEPALELLGPVPGGVYCDATLGGGGHAERILEASAPDGRLVGIDRDPNALEAAKKRLARFGDRVSILHGRFSQIEELLDKVGVRQVDGLLLDLGVSSHQLDEAYRGFSFMREGPLDMRMDPGGSGETAATLLSRIAEDELADIIFRFGEERAARRIARSIKGMAQEGRMSTTSDLAVAVRKVVGASKRKKDPATKTFQAIRIAVNDELGELESLLDLLPEPLAVGGRVVIITFHSLEDRLVKRRFSRMVDPCECPPGMPVCTCSAPEAAHITRRSVKVRQGEKSMNPRARSAKARAIRRVR